MTLADQLREVQEALRGVSRPLGDMVAYRHGRNEFVNGHAAVVRLVTQALYRTNSLIDAISALEAQADAFDYHRVREWALSKPRKPAATAFTASTNRDVAYLIEESQHAQSVDTSPERGQETGNGGHVQACPSGVGVDELEELIGYDPRQFPLHAAIEQVGLYPLSCSGGAEPYAERTDYMNGWNAAVMEITRNLKPLLRYLSPSKKPVSEEEVELSTAIHAMIGYCESLDVGTVITTAYMERMRSYYVPKLQTALAALSLLLSVAVENRIAAGSVLPV